ncbi:uroporphyrinogen decarboxylase family protein [Roseburia hominis]
MREIRDFHCTYDNSIGIYGDVAGRLGLSFPDAYLHAGTMAELSKALKQYDGAAFCELPFCHTVEAEAMGGSIQYGDAVAGPRAKEYVCNSLEEVLALPAIDFGSGRIHEVLLACQMLKESGEHVVLEVSGPFTILNVLIDAKYVFKGMKKKPELVKEVFWKLGVQILAFMEEAKRYGAEFISYADSSGSVSILGPHMVRQVAEGFTRDFLKKARQIADENTMLLLCPKTTFALLGLGMLTFRDRLLAEPMRYGDACLSMKGTVKIAGQTCIKNINYRLESRIFKEIVLV